MTIERDESVRTRVRQVLATREQHAAVPGFKHLWRQAQEPRASVFALRPALALAAAAGVALALLLANRQPATDPFGSLDKALLAGELWQGPTDRALLPAEPLHQALDDLPMITLPDAPPVWPFSET